MPATQLSGPGATPAAAGPAFEERFYAPATLTPIVIAPPRAPEKRRVPVVAILVVAIVVAGAIAAYATVGSGPGSASASASKTPVTLPPIAGSAGLPNLADAIRLQAEATRQRAFVTVAEASTESNGAALDAQALRNMDPSLEWVTGEQSSTGPRVVSFSQSADTVTVAVSTKGGDVCAFGHWSPTAISEYVTLGNVSSCRAADAPATGWTQLTEIGGSRAAPPDGS